MISKGVGGRTRDGIMKRAYIRQLTLRPEESATLMAGHNKSRLVEDLLQRTEGKPPSFTVNLYPDYWSLNNGARFHYHIPMAV